MGRNMFGPIGGGPWRDDEWKGWWGRAPIAMPSSSSPITRVIRWRGREGRLTTSPPTASRPRWSGKEAAGGKDVMLYGGAQVVNEYLAAGLLDVLELHVVPLLLGGGARLFRRRARGEARAGPGGRGARGHALKYAAVT